MSTLHDILVAQIVENGPITIAEFMSTCLLHPDHGYYATRDPFGAAGDFITAPEISQMFGELIGLAMAQAWIDQRQPSRMILAELGPGRGTLMRDALRAMTSVPGLNPEVHLVEASATLRDIQRNTLAGFNPVWHDQFADLPEGPLFVIANEFFDALAIRQFVRGTEHWHERRVGVLNSALCFGLSGETPIAALEDRLKNTEPGDIVEISPAAVTIMAQMDQRIAGDGGAAIIVDYGDWMSRGDTFQAVSGHAYCDPLENLGTADLTAHVDFAALSNAVTRAQASDMILQGEFLQRLGIAQRSQALERKLSGSSLEAHHAALHRLTHADEMGNLFKVIAIWPKSAPPVAGFT